MMYDLKDSKELPDLVISQTSQECLSHSDRIQYAQPVLQDQLGLQVPLISSRIQ